MKFIRTLFAVAVLSSSLLAQQSGGLTYTAQAQFAVQRNLRDGTIVRLKESSGVTSDWLWDATSTTTANSTASGPGTIINGPGGTGRFLRQFDGPIIPEWFGAVGDNIADDTTEIQAAVDAAIATTGRMRIPNKLYKISDTITFDVAEGFVCEWDGKFKATTAIAGKPAIKIGNDSTSIYGVKFTSGIRVERDSADISTGSTGVELRNIILSQVNVARCLGFQTGVLVNGTGSGSSHIHLTLGTIQDNQTNLRFTGGGASGYSNEHTVYGGSFNHAIGYPDFSNTIDIKVDHEVSNPINNICFIKPSLEGNSDLSTAAIIEGQAITIFSPRVETSATPANFNINFTANSLECELIGSGFTYDEAVVINAGVNNKIQTRNGESGSYQSAVPSSVIPYVGMPSAHKSQSTTAGASIAYMALSPSGSPVFYADCQGRGVFMDSLYCDNGLRWGTSSGSLIDRGLYNGNGSPEGVVTANPGSIYSNKLGGAGVTFYVKESGGGSTGWKKIGSRKEGQWTSTLTGTSTVNFADQEFDNVLITPTAASSYTFGTAVSTGIHTIHVINTGSYDIDFAGTNSGDFTFPITTDCSATYYWDGTRAILLDVQDY